MMLPAIKLSRNSWHWRLATYYSKLPYDHHNQIDCTHPEYNTDICTYLRSVAWGLLKIIVAFVIVSGSIVIPLAYTLAWLAVSYSMGYFLPLNEAVRWVFAILAVFAALAAVIAGAFCVHVVKQQLDKRAVKPSKPGFMSAVRERFKNKTCISIGFK